MGTVNTEYKLRLRGGGNMVYCKPVFPNDPWCSLLCASDNKLKVLRNGKCIFTHNGHNAKITSIVVNPNNEFQALTSSLDCTVIRWDWIFGGLVSQYKFEHPVFAVYPDRENSYFAITGTHRESCNLIRFTLSENLREVVRVKVLSEGLVGAENQCAVGCKGEFVAFIKRKSLFVYNTATKELKKYNAGKHLTCVTCHPTENCIATGCKDGSIVLWQNFLDAKSSVLKSVKHWHSLPVRALEYTSEGSVLLSGGFECVLVKWALPAFKKSNTLPRLESPVVGIACSKDSAHYAVCYSDNGLQVINNHFVIEHTYQGLVMAYTDNLMMKRPIETGLHFDPRSGAVVLNGRHGHLQFFNVKNEEQLYQLNITGENFISPDSLDNPLDLTEVENIAFDVNGDWLATIERRNPKHDSCVWGGLKFWSYEKESMAFTLNTFASIEYDATHREKVCTLKFRPSGDPLAVTVCPEEKIFKLWCIVEDDREGIFVWRPFWERGFMEKKPTSGDFHESGEVLAVAFEDEVAFFDPEKPLKSPVTHSPTDDDMSSSKQIRTIVWANGWYNDRMLLGATDSCLFAYNYITRQNQWHVELNGITAMVSNPRDDGCIAVFSRNKLSVYKPSAGSDPSFTYDLGDRAVITAAFDICSSRPSINTLYFMTKDQEPRKVEVAPVFEPIPDNWAHHGKCSILHSCSSCTWNQEHSLLWRSEGMVALDTRGTAELEQELFSLVDATEEELTDGDLQHVHLEQKIPMGQLRLKTQKKPVVPVGDNKTSKQLLKETINMPIYAMPPVEILCNQSLEAMAKECLAKKNQPITEERDDESEEEEKEDKMAESSSDEEVEEEKEDEEMDI